MISRACFSRVAWKVLLWIGWDCDYIDCGKGTALRSSLKYLSSRSLPFFINRCLVGTFGVTVFTVYTLFVCRLFAWLAAGSLSFPAAYGQGGGSFLGAAWRPTSALLTGTLCFTILLLMLEWFMFDWVEDSSPPCEKGSLSVCNPEAMRLCISIVPVSLPLDCMELFVICWPR